MTATHMVQTPVVRESEIVEECEDGPYPRMNLNCTSPLCFVPLMSVIYVRRCHFNFDSISKVPVYQPFLEQIPSIQRVKAF